MLLAVHFDEHSIDGKGITMASVRSLQISGVEGSKFEQVPVGEWAAVPADSVSEGASQGQLISCRLGT